MGCGKSQRAAFDFCLCRSIWSLEQFMYGRCFPEISSYYIFISYGIEHACPSFDEPNTSLYLKKAVQKVELNQHWPRKDKLFKNDNLDPLPFHVIGDTLYHRIYWQLHLRSARKSQSRPCQKTCFWSRVLAILYWHAYLGFMDMAEYHQLGLFTRTVDHVVQP